MTVSKVEVVVLGLLADEPMHGYDLLERFRTRSMGFWVEVGKASVYQVLKRLEREGSITGKTQEGTDGPDRRVYRLTRQGRQRLSAGLAERWSALAPYETDAGVALGFAHLVPAGEARAAIDDRDSLGERSVGRGPHRARSDEGRRFEREGGLQRHAPPAGGARQGRARVAQDLPGGAHERPGVRGSAETSETRRTMDDDMEAAFFDLDKTIISRSSSLAVVATAVSGRHGVAGASWCAVRTPNSSICSSGADEEKMERLKEGMLALTKGWDRSQIEDLVRDVLFDVIDPWVYQEALDLIALHRSEGRRIYIVSSSPEEVVRPLARHFGASGVIATQAQVDDTGRYTGELAFYAYGEQKAEAIRGLAQRLGLEPRRQLRVQRLGHRRADARCGGQPRGGQSRQSAPAGSRRARVADPRLPTSGAAAFTHREGRARRPRSASGRPSAPPRWPPSWCGSSCDRGSRNTTTTPERARDGRRVAVIRARVYGRRGCRKASARGAEPTRESCRGRHAQDPVAGRRRPPSTCRRDA